MDKLENVPEKYRSQINMDSKVPSRTSSPHLTTISTPLPLPIPETNAQPVAWFKAEQLRLDQDSRVASWAANDQYTLNALQSDLSSQPAFSRPPPGNLPAVVFNGKSSFLSADDIAFQLNRSDSFAITYVLRIDYSASVRPQMVWSIHRKDRRTDVLRAGFTVDGRLRIKCTSGIGKDYFDSQPLAPVGIGLYTIVFQPDRVSAFYNGNFVYSHPIDPAVDYGQAATFSIGQEWDDGVAGDFMKGDLYEMIIFNQSIGDKQRAELEAQLINKYNIVPK